VRAEIVRDGKTYSDNAPRLDQASETSKATFTEDELVKNGTGAKPVVTASR